MVEATGIGIVTRRKIPSYSYKHMKQIYVEGLIHKSWHNL
jgi:hypothetical protein